MLVTPFEEAHPGTAVARTVPPAMARNSRLVALTSLEL